MRFRPGPILSSILALTIYFVDVQDLTEFAATRATAQSQTAAGVSGLPLPRFVSLKSGRVNMRIGPGTDFKVEWLYLKKGLPMEIIQEYDNWRRVRDPEGNEGWILHSLLAGKRTVIFKPWDSGNTKALSVLHESPSSTSRVVAKVEPGVVGNVVECDDTWCRVDVGDLEGYAEKTLFWGVYPDELIEP